MMSRKHRKDEEKEVALGPVPPQKLEDLTVEFYTDWHSLRTSIVRIRQEVPRMRVGQGLKVKDPLVTHFLRLQALDEDVEAQHREVLASIVDPALRGEVMHIAQDLKTRAIAPLDAARLLRIAFTKHWTRLDGGSIH